MLTNSLAAAFGCVITVVTLLWMSGRLTTRQYAGWMSIAYALAGVLCFINRWTDVACMAAACTARFVWLWWSSGGGDDTKHRLKSWGRRFQGVRRTAPSNV